MMDNIFGRKKEIAVFNDVLASRESEFIAVKGRRRVGKTFLVTTFFKEQTCFYMTGVPNQPIKTQLTAFANELSYRQKKTVDTPKDWLKAFWMLRNYVETVETKTKKVIFIDDLSWMDTPKSNFIQLFAHFWNSWAAWEKNIILVIAGSSTSWIVNKIYNDRGGFHNRVTKRIWLEPFKLSETEAFFKNKNITLTRYDIVLIYMAFGGVPFYLNEVKIGESAAQCIERLCFEEGGLLKNEFDNLYASIFDYPEAHIRIAKVLAQHPYGMEKTKLLKQAKVANSDAATKILEELVTNDYLEHIIPYGKKSNNGKYVLADFYSRFYLTFISPQKNANWMSEIDTPAYKTWSKSAFESLCHYHKLGILKGLGINGVRTQTSYFNIKDDNGKMIDQIDMLIDRADNVLSLCEIKFSNNIYTLSQTEFLNIRNKVWYLQGKLKRRKAIYPVMITPFGCEKNIQFLGLFNYQLDMDCLFLD
jgi:uncharacterized protein